MTDTPALPPLPDLSSFDGHTEGLWEARQEYVNRWRIEVPQKGSTTLTVGFAYTDVLRGSDKDTAANARLIAAAPVLLAHVRALRAENERLLAIIDRGQGAINAAIEQTQAEYANHDTRAERYYLKVEAWRKEARTALAASGKGEEA